MFEFLFAIYLFLFVLLNCVKDLCIFISCFFIFKTYCCVCIHVKIKYTINVLMRLSFYFPICRYFLGSQRRIFIVPVGKLKI